MKAKHYFLVSLLALLCYSTTNAQQHQYTYKREIKGISNTWHKIPLSEDILSKLNSNFSDLRIIGLNSAGDSVEAPFLFEVSNSENTRNSVSASIRNRVSIGQQNYFTLELPQPLLISEIELDIQQMNFDWRVKVEGSNNEKQWFTIIDDYRILAINQPATNYRFTKILFQESRFQYFRLQITSDQKPIILDARVNLPFESKSKFQQFRITESKINTNRAEKQSEIDVCLPLKLPVSRIQIPVKSKFNYSRPIIIKYLSDSFSTPQGQKYSFKVLETGMLKSGNEGVFIFPPQQVQQIKIEILNNDNPALEIDSVEVAGYTYHLLARFTQEANFQLFYGASNSTPPNYDLEEFTTPVSDSLIILIPGKEQPNKPPFVPTKETFFGNAAVLWAIIIIVILILGWFSLHMIRNK